jgi:predicted dehydrogenase
MSTARGATDRRAAARKLRVGILGAGSWSARAHIPALHEDPDVELVVLNRRDEELGTAMARQHGFTHFEPDWREALRHDLDVVVVNSPPSLHVEHVCASLEAGAHVLCEKPFALNLEEAVRMVEAASRSQRTLLIGFGWNRHPTFGRARDVVVSELGRAELMLVGLQVGVRELYTGSLPPSMREREVPPDPSTYNDPKLAGGGVLFGAACHALALMLWFCGNDARTVTSHAYRTGQPPLDIHDTICVEYDDGSQVAIVVTSVPSPQGRVRWDWTAYAEAGTVTIASPIPTRTTVSTGDVVSSMWLRSRLIEPPVRS